MTETRFEVHAEEPAGETLLTGFTNPGVAGLSVVDDFVTGEQFEQIGYVSIDGFPAMTPLSDGAPRHPIRLYAGTVDGLELTVVVSEMFVPVWAGEPFVDGLVEWLDATPISEVVTPSGIPFPHDEEGHVVSYAATADFRERRLAETDIGPLPGGFVDGIVSELLLCGLATPDLDVGVLVTPVHLPGPDLQAALLLRDAIQTVFDVELGETTLAEQAEAMQQAYSELADRLAALEEQSVPREFSEDRMYM
jgi:uncharacterized protein